MTKPNEAQATQAASPKQAEPVALRDPRMEKFDKDGPLKGMIAAFEMRFGQSWTDKDWRNETAAWAAAWSASLATPQQAVSAQELSDEQIEDLVNAKGRYRRPVSNAEFVDFARAVLAAARAQQAPQAVESQAIGAEGQWRWVPIKPTKEMQSAGRYTSDINAWELARKMWAAMIAAAPDRAATPAGEGA